MQAIQVPAKLEHLEAINAYIDASVPPHLSALVPPVKLAAEEFLVNIFSYAYPDTLGTVEVHCGVIPDNTTEVFLRIKDWGPAFNPFDDAPNPDITLDVESRPMGGLGVYLIKQISYSQSYQRENDNSNSIEVTFRLPQETLKASPLLALLLAFSLACPVWAHAQSQLQPVTQAPAFTSGTIISEERETVMLEAVPVSRAMQASVPSQQGHREIQSPAPTAPPLAHSAAVIPTERASENLLNSMDVYTLSPHARFLSQSYVGVRPVYGAAYRFAPSQQASSGWQALPGGTKSAAWAEVIAEASQLHGLPPGLIAAVIRVESAFNPYARSAKGAQGLMQIMPDTQRFLGLADPYDAEANIMAGSRYLKEQMDAFGSLELALAAYNAGPGNVQRHGGIPPFAETQGFVRKVMSSIE